MIKLVNVSKYYNSSNKVVLGLRKINLELEKGEFVAITGESGSGKSTLLNVISGVDTYEDGEMYFDNQPTSYYDSSDWEEYRRDKIGFIFQNYNLIESYTVLENILAALKIQNIDSNEAISKAMAVIAKVGLTGKEKNRAVQLSSGQKQRLSIARALVKDTDVIIADEPTGNLDVENGKQIIQLLYEISKEKLVIMVTHNYDEVEDYATRKIRMFDGEIQSNIVLRDNYLRDNCLKDNIDSVNKTDNIDKKDTKEYKGVKKKSENIQNKQGNDINKIKGSSLHKDVKRKNNIDAAWYFTKRNIKAQPKKAIFLFVFFLFISFASYIFLGGFVQNLDDTHTKIFDNSAFRNGDMTRIAVRNHDDSEITDEDVERMKSIKRVISVDKYGFANDMCYAYRNGIDYEKNYFVIDPNLQFKNPDLWEQLVKRNDFINELGCKDVDVSVRVKDTYIRSACNLNQNDLCMGRLPEQTNEIVLCSMDKSLIDTVITYYFTNSTTRGFEGYIEKEMKVVGLIESDSGKTYFSDKLMCMLSSASYILDTRYFVVKDAYKYPTTSDALFVINENLQDNEAVIAVDIFKHLNDIGQPYYNFMPKKLEWGMSGTKKETDPYYAVTEGELDVRMELHEASKMVVEVSPKTFYTIYKPISTQASIFIEDYAYTDYVLEALYDMGYEAVSPYRLGSINYSTEKVRARLMTLGICLGSLIVIYVLEIIIIKALLKFKKKDFVILRFIGLNSETMSYINYFELFTYQIVSMICSIIIVILLSSNNMQYIANIFKYYSVLNYTIYILLNLITVFALGYSYNVYLNRNSSVTKLSEF